MSIHCIMIASSKGGIGKSTVALGIATALSRMGSKVLLCDLDFGSPCLDMLTGAENAVLYTVSDLIKDRCSADEAAIRLGGGGSGTVYLLAAPAAMSCDTEAYADVSGAASCIKTAMEELGCDFAVIDTGAGISFGMEVAAKAADCALIVAGHSPVSLRSAEGTAQRVRDMGVEDIRLVINSFDSQGVCLSDGRKGIFSMIDTSGLPLCGVVPYDYSLALSQESRKMPRRRDGLSGTAFANIAGRLMQKNIPLFSGMKKMRKMRDKFYK